MEQFNSTIEKKIKEIQVLEKNNLNLQNKIHDDQVFIKIYYF